MIQPFVRLWRRLCADRRGNVFMIMGFALIPLTFSVGMGIDYARAARMQTRLNALADAAALATVTTPMMQQTDLTKVAKTAYDSWTQQSTSTNGMLTTAYKKTIISLTSESAATNCPTGTFDSMLDYSDGVLEVCVKETTKAGHKRDTKVTWHSDSKNSFASLLGFTQIALSGTSTTDAKQAPNIDFYVLLDSSGSMAFPSTSAGIAQMQAATPDHCAFACHNTKDTKAKDASGTMTDYYGVATSYNIPLRITEARTAIQSMMTTATNTEQNNKATYRAALFSFADKNTNSYNGYRQIQGLTSTLALVSTAASNVKTSFYYDNNSNYDNKTPSGNYNNNDTDTATSDAFTRINTAMPAPGNGSSNAGDKPQEIMFIITDGMRDENRSSGQPEIAIETSLCDTIKARGIRIGIIYTEYLADTLSDDWSKNPAKGNVLNRLPLVEPALQNCASSGLYYKVTTDQDISTALNQLFAAAVATAHITQ